MHTPVHTTFCGESAVRVESHALRLTVVPGWGSNAISLYDKRGELELFRVPASAEAYRAKPTLYGNPVLFPPNRIADGAFTFNGRKYQFDVNEPDKHNHIHGLLLHEPWELVKAEQGEDQAVIETEFDATAHSGVMAQFPHHFVVRMTFTLAGTSFQQKATVINRDTQPFPWGLGYHTTFNFPFRQGDGLEECRFSLTADKRWILDERLLPTGELTDMADVDELRSGMRLVGRSLDDVFQSSVQTDEENRAVLDDGNIGLRVIYDADEQFKQWVVFNKNGQAGLLCPEPYTWVTNAPNLDLPAELTGWQIVHPDEAVSASIHIAVVWE